MSDKIDESFRGDLTWIRLFEGHVGRPYWPGGRSGVTLDPGVDLGYVDRVSFIAAYDDILTPEDFKMLDCFLELRGADARRAYEKHKNTLSTIRVSKEQADRVFPVVAAPYWTAVTKRFPALRGPTTPASVQTALLSLAINRGASNRELEPLGRLIDDGDWPAVADVIGSMQQDHELVGIRRRRREEAALIRRDAGNADSAVSFHPVFRGYGGHSREAAVHNLDALTGEDYGRDHAIADNELLHVLDVLAPEVSAAYRRLHNRAKRWPTA